EVPLAVGGGDRDVEPLAVPRDPGHLAAVQRLGADREGLERGERHQPDLADRAPAQALVEEVDQALDPGHLGHGDTVATRARTRTAPGGGPGRAACEDSTDA